MKRLNFYLILIFVTFSCSTPQHSGRGPSSLLGCNQLIEEIVSKDYSRVRDAFSEELLIHYPDSAAEKIEANLDSLLFIDYAHTIQELYHFYSLAQSLETSQLRKLYNSYQVNSRANPINNFFEAQEFLKFGKPKFEFETMKELHSILMKGGVDGLPANVIGRARRVNIYGNATGEMAISKTIYDELAENVYVDVSKMVKNAQGKYEGYISYANIDQMKPQLLSKIKKIDPTLHAEIVEYQTLKKGNYEELTERMINALTEDLLSWFVKKKNELGKVTDVASFKKFTKLVAEFQKNLISIHPFQDGNGRTIRQFAIYFPFWREGLPAPRILDVNSDLYVSTAEWASRIADGVANSYEMYTAMRKRLKLGFPIESTPELMAPELPRKLGLSFKSKAGVREDYKLEAVDPHQFIEFYIRKLSDPDIGHRFTENADAVYKEIMESFEQFYKKSHLYYEHEKKGIEKLNLDFVDIDFIASFANKSFKDKKVYDFKMARWYSDETVWRGLSRQDKEISENEIVGMFSNLHYQFTSNAVAGQMGPRTTDQDVRRLVFNDFSRYNQDLFEDKLTAMAKDHSESGPMYGSSYGYSTSKNREVGKAFAMGAMVIAPYGQHREMQHMLKSRVLVGMKRAKKDVDLTRLKQLRNDFSYKYGRQQEVMGIGAADPDSVDFVQLIGADGKAFKSYVRNPRNPAQVLVFEGEVNSLEEVTARGARIIDLD